MDSVPPQLQLELFMRIAASVVLGGVLGWERQLGQHPAGLRTHVLVTLGAAAYTIAGTFGVTGNGTVQDAGRVAAQIVAGVGFLGAGTIWRSGSDRVIYGLTTAASIWVAASIGMLCGFGLYVLATACAVLGFGVLRLLKGLEDVPIRLSVPTLRRRSKRPGPHQAPAAGAEAGLAPGVSVGGTAYGSDDEALKPEPGAEPEIDDLEGLELDTVTGSKGKRSRPKVRGKKRRKRKGRDAELEAMAEISDAPPGRTS